jgi:hypothetical protein
MSDTTAAQSDVMTTKEVACYLRKTPNALKIMRHRRVGPRSFKRDGRIYYYAADVRAWLAEGANADSRFNPDLDPTRVPAQTRGHRAA